ncbi:MAG TPA: hypothetical protein PLA71_00505 [Saccharofermentans sp.]|nr:hypothetical protein [Saccharofermentans sp.]
MIDELDNMDDNMYDFGKEHAKTRKKECKNCGNVIEVSSQKDGDSTLLEVHVRCHWCGKSVKFLLPCS